MEYVGGQVKSALHKLLVLDTQFVFDTDIACLVAEVSIAKTQMDEQIAQLEVTISERTRELENLLRRDGLTGLLNQNAFYERLHHELAASERYKENLVLAYMDINGFKILNDTQSHVAGDQTLIQLSAVLKQTVRECDIPCRVGGGDEFAVIFPKTALEDARLVCERIVECLKKSELNQVTVSIGLAAGKEYYPSMTDLIRDADKNMYSSKSPSIANRDFYIN